MPKDLVIPGCWVFIEINNKGWDSARIFQICEKLGGSRDKDNGHGNQDS